MNTCPTFEELNALVDGHLPNERELDVRRHLDLCPTCGRLTTAVSRLKRAVGRAYGSEQPSLALRRAVVPQARRRGWRWWPPAMAALVCLASGIAVLLVIQAPAFNTLATAMIADHIRFQPAALNPPPVGNGM